MKLTVFFGVTTETERVRSDGSFSRKHVCGGAIGGIVQRSQVLFHGTASLDGPAEDMTNSGRGRPHRAR